MLTRGTRLTRNLGRREHQQAGTNRHSDESWKGAKSDADAVFWSGVSNGPGGHVTTYGVVVGVTWLHDTLHAKQTYHEKKV